MTDDKTHARIELIATVMLAIATVLTAWSAFESSKWGGVMSIDYATAGALRTESAKSQTAGGQLQQIDITLYLNWIAAVADDDERLQTFYEKRFRDDFVPAFDAYIATDPLNNPNAPTGPFSMEEYQLPELAEAADLEAQASAKSADAREANQRGDNYTLLTVLFASVLFFAGVSTKFDSVRSKTVMLVCGVLILVVGSGMLVTFPIEI